MNPFTSGPTPPYNCPPIEPQFYKPKRYLIDDIELGKTTLISTTEVTDYVIGQQVRLLIPPEFGSIQLNGKTGYVIDIVDIEDDTNILETAFTIHSTNGTNIESDNILTYFHQYFPNSVIVPASARFWIASFPTPLPPSEPYTGYLSSDIAGNIIYDSGPYTLSSGTIDYVGGEFTINFSVPPPEGSVIQIPFSLNITNSLLGEDEEIEVTEETTLIALILDIDSSQNVNEFFFDINSSTPAQILAIGDINSGILNVNGNLNTGLTIPGSFTNISPL